MTTALSSPGPLNALIAVASSTFLITSVSAAASLFSSGPWSTRTWIFIVLVALTATPVVALLQGIHALLRYRFFYKDAPVPKSPSHGVVVIPDTLEPASSSCSCCAPPLFREILPSPTAAAAVAAPCDNLDPLRVLVIGDSLAIGVGQSRNCCPVLPETIAKSLCRYFGGQRPVFWSCHGAPGASAGWIVRELEQRLPEKSTTTTKPLILHRTLSAAATITTTTDESYSETTSSTGSISSDDVDDDDDSGCESDGDRKVAFDMPYGKASDNKGGDHEVKDEKFWNQRLSEHACALESNPMDGHYDVVVVMTGSNDLKGAIFPFLLTGDDVEFRKEAQERGGSYKRELCRVLKALQPRLRKQPIITTSDRHDSSSSSDNRLPRLPLVVLPGMPADALPIFRSYPLHWVAVPIVNCMDRQKQKMAESRPDQVVFISPPSLNEICKFEAQCDQLLPEDDEFLKLRSVMPSECYRIRETMSNYYSSAKTHTNGPSPEPTSLPLSQRSGQAGTKIFSMDRIHPNDEGYDFWGRYIAKAIVDEWERRK